MLPLELVPGIASAEKELKLLIGRKGLRLGEVYETVEGEFDLVAEFVGAPYDSIKRFANLGEVSMRFCVNWETKKGEYSCASKDMDVVEMSEDGDEDFCGKVLDGGAHSCEVGSLDLRDEIQGRECSRKSTMARVGGADSIGRLI